MANIKSVKLPTSTPPLTSLTYANFPKGVITLINETNLPKTALKEAMNAMLYENGSAGPRWGIGYYGTSLPVSGAIDGAGSYMTIAGLVHLWAVINGTMYRSTDNGTTWVICTGVTFTAGYKVTGTQGNQGSSNQNFMFLTDGQDPIARYDGTTVLANFVSMASPTGVTAVQTGLTGTTYTYYYSISAINNIGSSIGTTPVTVQVVVTRNSWDPTNTGTKYVTLTWTAVTNAVRYDIFLTDNATDSAANRLFYIDSIGANASPAYIDRGQTTINPNAQMPIQDTSTGPTLGELQFVGSRLVGTRDKNNKYRVWWTGSGPFLGYFSDAYDGGYIDLQRGSQFYPVHVEDYHDGKATPLITIWCDSSDGRGCIWQMSLDSKTLQNSTYTQPNANKLPGSRGTNAPFSVVNVLNDYVYFNYQAYYNLGARAQFLNLLSTDESSGNIRPTLLANITPGHASTAASFYYRAKIFCSQPYNSSVNTNTAVYDTELKAWMPNAYTIGMERMFQYTDTLGVQHMLFWKPGDNFLSETSDKILGDYGVGFRTSITTGLLPVDAADRFAFMYVEQSEIEFSNPQGNINVELIGIERSRGYSIQKTVTVAPQSTQSNVGWSTAAWSTQAWDTSGTVVAPYLELSSKKYFNTQRELNAHQWHITSTSLVSSWLIRQLQIQGTMTNAGLPRQWRLTAS